MNGCLIGTLAHWHIETLANSYIAFVLRFNQAVSSLFRYFLSFLNTIL